jgi:hypothetical protein
LAETTKEIEGIEAGDSKGSSSLRVCRTY